MADGPYLDVILVNTNSGSQLRECLATVPTTDRTGFTLNQVIVVDNASTDSSIEGLGEAGVPVRILRNPTNRGFAAACNQAAQVSRADYLLFLNSDTMLSADSLAAPVRFMEDSAHQKIGIIGIQLVDAQGVIHRSCARFPTPARILYSMVGLDKLFPGMFPGHFMTDWDHSSSRTVEQIMGAFFLVRRSLFEQLGRFDERFFVYFEEVDFSIRAERLGYASYYFAGTSIYHKGGGETEKMMAHRLFFSLRSRIFYSFKHFNPFSATIVFLATLTVEPVSRLLFSIVGNRHESPGDILRAYGFMWKETPRIAGDLRKVKTVERVRPLAPQQKLP